MDRFLQRRWLPAFILLALSLIPRTMALGRYITPDETFWLWIGIRFRQAIINRDWAGTIQMGQPGVMSSWLGDIAVQLAVWVKPALNPNIVWAQQLAWLSPENSEAYRQLYPFLNPARGSAIGVHLAAILAWFWLGRRRTGRLPAFITAALLAINPFIAGWSGVFQLDGLQGSFILLSILFIVPVTEPDDNRYLTRRAIVLSGMFSAAAILTKLPALTLLPLLSGWLAWLGWKRQSGWQTIGGNWFLYWGGAGAALLALLPATWAHPAHVASVIAELGSFETGLSAAAFYLGEVGNTAGTAFYPLTILFRLSIAGMVGLAFAAWQWRRLPEYAALCLLFSAIFLLGIDTASTRKFARYALPALMAMMPAASWGLAQLWQAKAKWAIALLCLDIVALAIALPYPRTAYNWAFGGLPMAQKLLPVDSDEAVSSAAKIAAQTPNAADQIFYTHNIPAAAPFFPGIVARPDQIQLLGLAADDWLMETLTERQLAQPPLAPANGETVPIRLNGQTWGWLTHQHSPTYDGQLHLTPRYARFGADVAFLEAAVAPAAYPNPVTAMITWQALRPADYRVQLSLIDAARNEWAQVELPLLNGVDQMASGWQAGETQPPTRYQLPLPADLPPDSYQLHVRLFDENGGQLGTFDQDGAFTGTQAFVGETEIAPPISQPAIIPPITTKNGGELIGHSGLPATIRSGEWLQLELWRRQVGEQDVQGTLFLQLAGTTIQQPIALVGWGNGQIGRIKGAWQVPATLPLGALPVSLTWRDDGGLRGEIELGEIQVEAGNHLFTLPDGFEPLQIEFGDEAILQTVEFVRQNDQLRVKLWWQADQPSSISFTRFIHLLDNAGVLVAQLDSSPLPATSGWLTGEIIVDEVVLPLPATATQAAIGFYDPLTGARIPVGDTAGMPLRDAQFLMPIPPQ